MRNKKIPKSECTAGKTVVSKAAAYPKKKSWEKVLLRKLDGNWVEYAAWHLGPLDCSEPNAHLGWEILQDAPVTQPPWQDQYDRWVKMRWAGIGFPFEID